MMPTSGIISIPCADVAEGMVQLPANSKHPSKLSVLEENANPDARICPLTHVSVDRAYQAESVRSNSLLSILIAICRSPNL